MHERLLERMLDLSIASGGCVKFDLKAWDDTLHRVLTGVTNKQTLRNFSRAGKRIHQRPVPPPLIASTLLVPGYVDEEEVGQISTFTISGVIPTGTVELKIISTGYSYHEHVVFYP